MACSLFFTHTFVLPIWRTVHITTRAMYIMDNKVADDMSARPQCVKVKCKLCYIYMAVVHVCAINNELCVNERCSVYVLQRFIFRFIIFFVSTATHPITRRFASPEPSSFVVYYIHTYYTTYSYTFCLNMQRQNKNCLAERTPQRKYISLN